MGKTTKRIDPLVPDCRQKRRNTYVYSFFIRSRMKLKTIKEEKEVLELACSERILEI